MSCGYDESTNEKLYWIYKIDYDALSKSEKNDLLNIAIQNDHIRNRNQKVYCLNTMELFPSIKDAAEYAGLKKSTNIRTACKKDMIGKSGHHPITNEPLYWIYLDDYNKLSEEKKTNISFKYKKE